MKRLETVTLQVSLAPTDLPHARHIVPHQLRQWAAQVDEILFTLDLHRSRGRFSEGWDERLPGLRRLMDECCATYSHARCVDVDYGEQVTASVASTFFGGRPVPPKDYRGGPFYTYFFGLHAAHHDHVLHLDSDMLFGGGSTTWVAEALHLLDTRPDVLACNPLAGPPTSDGSLCSQTLERETMDCFAYRSRALSTRLFLLDRRRLSQLSLERPPWRQGWTARLEGNPPFTTPESIISGAMARRGLLRVDFLGAFQGMWSVHPPYRSESFYTRLPSLIRTIERGDVPEGQRGYHDMEDCMVDWTDVRPTRRKRIETHSRLMLERALLPARRS